MKTRLTGRLAVLEKAVRIVVVLLALTVLSVKAQEGKGQRKKQTIDFEDELVEGELKKPELFYLLQKKQFNYKRLIKLREDFLPEMKRDAEEVGHSRSN